jgi:hypothetical protein
MIQIKAIPPSGRLLSARWLILGDQMYQNAAMLASFLLIHSAVPDRIERSWISGPIVFTGVGFILPRNFRG